MEGTGTCLKSKNTKSLGLAEDEKQLDFKFTLHSGIINCVLALGQTPPCFGTTWMTQSQKLPYFVDRNAEKVRLLMGTGGESYGTEWK